MRTVIRTALIAIILLGAAMLILNWAFERAPVDMAKLQSIKPGARQEEVRAALGKPTDVYDSNRKWAYSRPLGWSIVYIYFDEQGRFSKYEYDR